MTIHSVESYPFSRSLRHSGWAGELMKPEDPGCSLSYWEGSKPLSRLQWNLELQWLGFWGFSMIFLQFWTLSFPVPKVRSDPRKTRAGPSRWFRWLMTIRQNPAVKFLNWRRTQNTLLFEFKIFCSCCSFTANPCDWLSWQWIVQAQPQILSGPLICQHFFDFGIWISFWRDPQIRNMFSRIRSCTMPCPTRLRR